MPLNAKQTAFIQNYLITGNATQSAISSGYSKKTAYAIGQRLLKKVEVKEAITKAQLEAAKACKVTLEEVLSCTREVVEYARQMKDGKMVAPKEVLKGAEILGKLGGFFTEKLQHSTDKDNPFSIEVTFKKPE